VARTIRFIETIPVTVRNDSDEGTTHDIERYCAFQQNSFQEAEASNEPSVGYLAKAREARMSLLDSVDKSITIIHLLTNNRWGPEVAQFLSCRQSVPARDKLNAWGDRAVASDTKDASFKRMVDSVQSNVRAFRSHANLLNSLRELKYIFELRCTEDGVVAIIELLPTLQRSLNIASAATLSLSDVERPIIKTIPLLKTLSDRGYELVIERDSSQNDESSINSIDATKLPVLEELSRYRTIALDYVIISKILDELESSTTSLSGWVLTHSSRCIDSLSLSLVGPGGMEISIRLSNSCKNPTSDTYRRFARQIYLESCCAQPTHPKSMVSRLIEYILESRH
jgi:hypothetical protein